MDAQTQLARQLISYHFYTKLKTKAQTNQDIFMQFLELLENNFFMTLAVFITIYILLTLYIFFNNEFRSYFYKIK